MNRIALKGSEVAGVGSGHDSYAVLRKFFDVLQNDFSSCFLAIEPALGAGSKQRGVLIGGQKGFLL